MKIIIKGVDYTHVHLGKKKNPLKVLQGGKK
jgi:hypothetical protein